MSTAFNVPDAADVVRDLERHAPALAPLVHLPGFRMEEVLSRPLELAETEDHMRAHFHHATAQLHDLHLVRSRLRILRHQALVRIALREIYALASVEQTAREMSYLAAGATNAALTACLRNARDTIGVARRLPAHDADTPSETRGQTSTSGSQDIEMTGNVVDEVPLVVLGMGKLGGGELNLGSDIDLCVFYETDDAWVQPAHPKHADITVNELYCKVVGQLARMLSEITEEGFCFRVDLRLRPEGSQGPLAQSFASAERYYESWGRTWERAALVRAAPIAGDLAAGREFLRSLRSFVYRKAVRPELAIEMAEMIDRSRRELRIDEARDLKLGHGGIREIEFFVQTLQLVWGGLHPELQCPNTLQALQQLEVLGLVSHVEAHTLRHAWSLMRQIEHRVQVRQGYQVHEIPRDESELSQLAVSLGWSCSEEFLQSLAASQSTVHQLFHTLQPGADHDPPAHAGGAHTAPWRRLHALCDRIASRAEGESLRADVMGELQLTDESIDEAMAHLQRLSKLPFLPLSEFHRERLPSLAPLLLRECALSANPLSALRSLADFFLRLPAIHPYGRLLSENPTLARRLIGLFGASPTLAGYVIGHPEELDDVLFSHDVPDSSAMRESHRSIFTSGPLLESWPDEEQFVDLVREKKRQLLLRLGVLYIDGKLDHVQASRALTQLAESQISTVLDYCLHATQQPDAAFVVVGVGKLGARELSFRSDLDLLFLHREPDLGALERLTKLAQRVLRLLSQPSRQGNGYTLDTRLRPSGSHGLLVLSADGFERHHATQAASWERQALIRARPVAGHHAMQVELSQMLDRVAYRAPISPDDVTHVKRRIERELGCETGFKQHVKYGFGGIVEIEFLTQFLQLQHHAQRELHTPNTVQALERMAPRQIRHTDAEVLLDAYHLYRRIEYACALLDDARDLTLQHGSPFMDSLARMLHVHAPTQAPPGEQLLSTYRRKAEAVREVYERVVAPIGASPPWHHDRPVRA
jgi:glutamate-ammonia-ligase adenylyltransferase